MSFNINGAAFKGIGVLGAGQPEAGYYEVEVLQVEHKAGDKADARRLHVQFGTGFKMFTFIHLPVEGLPEKSFKGRLAALKTILASLGYTDEQIETGEISDGWFITAQNGGRKAHVEFVPGQQGVQGSYAEITKFLDKAAFEKAVASGAKPAARQGGVPRAGGGVPGVAGAVPASPSASVGGTVATVAPAPAGGLRLPPPPAVGVTR